MPTKKTTKKTTKKVTKKTTKRSTITKVSDRVEIKKDGKLFVMYLDGARRRAFRSIEDAMQYIQKRHLDK